MGMCFWILLLTITINQAALLAATQRLSVAGCLLKPHSNAERL
jgi:hypothetical protein